MKNSKTLPSALCIAAGLSRPTDEAPDCRVTTCHNLRPATDGAPELVPVGRPAPIAAGNYRPLAAVTLDDGRRLLAVSSGKTLATLDLSAWMPEPVEIVQLDSEPVCAAATGRRLTVMTDDGATTVIFGNTPGDVAVITPSTQFPEITVTAETAAKAVASIAPVKLDSSLAQGNTYVDSSQRHRITTAMNEAYMALARQAAADGAFFQPVICRYRLYDSCETVIYVSPPIMLSLPAGSQLTGPIAFRSDDMATTYPVDISADTYRIKLGIPAHSLPARVAAAAAKAVVFVTPQYHPTDFSLLAPCTAKIRSTTDNTVLRASYPGTMRGLTEDAARAAESLLRESISRLNTIEKPVMTIPDPFSSKTGRNITINAAATTDPIEENQTISRALRAAFTPRYGIGPIFEPPHSFTAGCVVSSGGTTIWGNLTQRFFKGYGAGAFAVTTKPGRWRAAIWIDITETVADPEESVVCICGGDSNAPDLFSPIISYPSGRATKMTINLAVEGEEPVTRTFELTRVGCDMAVYVHPTLRPFAIDTPADAFVIPAERPAVHSFPSMMVVARTSSPLSAIATADLAAGRVNALAVCRYSPSSLTVRQQRFTVFASRGIHSLVLSEGNVTTLSEFDRRTVASQEAVVYADGKVYAATTSQQIIRICASSAETIAEDIDACAMAWIALRRELMCIGADGKTTVFCLGYGQGRYTRSLPDISHIVADDTTAEVYALGSGGVVSLVNEVSPATVSVAWSLTVDTPSRQPAVASAMTVDMGAAHFRGTVGLTRHSSLTPAPDASTAFSVDGRVGAPLILRNLGHAAPRFTVDISGETAPQFALNLIKFDLTAPRIRP